ncbi:MAG: enoyl-CoA hydratase/isomerase family protein [Gaiellaceae bacterium]
MADELIVKLDEEVARLYLNRPDQRNAMTPELVDELLEALDEVEAEDEIRCVVITGMGKAFCAGFDVSRIPSATGTEAREAARMVEKLGLRVRGLRMPVIAMVNGPASGAGCDLAVSCDVRIASSAAKFAMPPARLGVLYDEGGMRRLLQTVGLAAAKELLLTGELIEADRALELGLVNRVVGPDRLEDTTKHFVRTIVENAPLSVAASKLACNVIADAAPLPPDAQTLLDHAAERVWGSEDAAEGPAAFKERRQPRFRGR